MATSLQQQLAAINAKSTDQLNLKAQKARHSQSLLFEPREAVKQSFDTLFQICQEGFAELCQLDRRYISFAQGLFADSSVSVEREHMTKAENKELDAVIEQFLGLVSGKLLLRPAQKSVEWLVRRWRIHEYNTSTMLLAFLPYHAHEIFPTVLSILPKRIPDHFKFLAPYITALRGVPRHALVTAAVSTPQFISAYSTFVLSAAKRKLQSSILVGSWISIYAQSLNARLDNALSGRDAVRREKSEDVLLETLPTLQDMVSIPNAPDLFLAACMIMTILATKMDLQDRVLDALMESIVTSWTADTVRDAAECLAVLAEEKEDATIPKPVATKIIESDEAVQALLSLEHNLRADKLITGLQQHIATYQRTALVKRLIERGSKEGLAVSVDVEMADADDVPLLEAQSDTAEQDFSSVIDTLPTLPTTEYSFLASDDSILNDEYINTMSKCGKDESSWAELISIPALHASDVARPETLSLLARCWSVSSQQSTRQAALELASQHIIKTDSKLVYQSLYPYIFKALTDSSPQVRKAAARLLQDIVKKESGLGSAPEIWAMSSIYGTASSNISWLSAENASTFLQNAVVPRLEDCILDPAVLATSLSTWLNDKSTKSLTRIAICDFLASHAVASGVRPVQLILFNILSKTTKASLEARQAIVIPYINSLLQRSPADSTSATTSKAYRELAEAAVHCLSHRSNEEIDALKSAAATSSNDIMADVAHARIVRVFRQCKADSQLDLASWLFAQAVERPDEAKVQLQDSLALDTLRALHMPIEALASLLSSVAKTGDQERPAKRQRISKSGVSKGPVDIDAAKIDQSLRQATLCLELVEDTLSQAKQHSEESQHYALLVKQLFNVLSDLQAWRLATGSDLTYLQALALNNILATLNLISTGTAQPIDHTIMRTDMIVETLRSTSSPQIHNSALLVISKIATFAPDTVLHSVMPLFTFMSSSTLRQADAYSVHVINMTIESIVPPLRISLKARGKDLVAGASDLLLSFTAAFEHIPGHRRHDVFVQLLKVLGPQESLYAVMAMLIERYHEDNTLVDTLQAIMDSFDVKTQAHALAQYLDLIADACKKRRGLSDSILGFSEKNVAEANASIAVLLDGWASLTSSSSLQSRVKTELRKDDAVQALRDSYSTLLEKLVALSRNAASTANFDEPTLKSAHDTALKALLALLPTEEFIASSAGLMQAGSEQARVRVFSSLTDRANAAKGGDIKFATVFLESLPNCSVFLSTSQPLSVRKAALECVDAICEKFGKRDREAVSNVAQALLTDAALLSNSSVLQIASLLCLASAVEVLREEFVSIAGQALNRALHLLASTLESDEEDWALIEASFTLLNAVLDNEVWLIDATVLDRAIVLVCQTQELDDERSFSAKQFCELLPKQAKMHDMLSAIDRTFDMINQLGEDAMSTRAQMIHTAVASNPKTAVTKEANLLGSLMLKSFGSRVSPDMDEDGEQDAILEAYKISLQTALNMTLKMNDITFRPIFMRLVAWADNRNTQSSSQAYEADRQIALYDFSQRLFEQLGSIMTTYAGFLLDNASAILSSERSDEQWHELAVAVLRTLTASFKHDQDDFWSAPQHFDAIVGSVLGLTIRPIEDNTAVHVAVVELASAVSGSPEHLKTINAQLMIALRAESAATRLEAVKCQRKITDRLTFDWLNLLPEMLPYISELLEDDDEAVEREVLSWVAQIEEVTGESLEGMLS